MLMQKQQLFLEQSLHQIIQGLGVVSLTVVLILPDFVIFCKSLGMSDRKVAKLYIYIYI